MDLSPRIVCIPSSDAEFAARVRGTTARMPRGLDDGAALAWLQHELRRSYPAAAVRAREDLARIGPADPVWYVSRREYGSRIDTGVCVRLPQAVAFRLYVERVADWQTAVNLRPVHLSPKIVGNEYEAHYAFLGRRVRGRFRILAADPPSSLAFEAEGSGIQVWYRTSFVADGDVTLVSVKGDYQLPDGLVSRIADRLVVERTITRDIERANASFVALCDAWRRGEDEARADRWREHEADAQGLDTARSRTRSLADPQATASSRGAAGCSSPSDRYSSSS
jgi:hypothetical protein